MGGCEGDRGDLMVKLIVDFCTRAYEEMDIPAARLGDFAAAKRLREQYIRFENMGKAQLLAEAAKHRGQNVDDLSKQVLLKRLKTGALWGELPITELRSECRSAAISVTSYADSGALIKLLTAKLWTPPRKPPSAPWLD